MRDILKIMRFDFLTAKPLAMGVMILVAVIFGSLGMVLSPIIITYIIFAAMLFVIPLQGVADKSGFNKLYGTLPVRRKNITRARFLYIYLVHIITELLELVLVTVSFNAGLNRLLPQSSMLMQFAGDSFEDISMSILFLFALVGFFCLLFSYMEMMGQIYGRENEFKILMISIGVLTLLIFMFTILNEHDLIPLARLPRLPESTSGILAFGAVLDLVLLGICLIFGEITASKLIKREL